MGKIVNRVIAVKTPADDTKTAAAPRVDKPKTAVPGARKELAEAAREAADVFAKAGLEPLSRGVTELMSKAVRDKFTVCFVGEFSHGKSTLINKLLGVDTLPTDSLPTTALLTRITAGRRNQIEVYDNRGKLLKKLPVDSESWKELVAVDEDGNMIDTEDRYLVKLTLNNDWLAKGGFDIMDTPGANDGSKIRDMEISRALMIADGVVVCVDAQKGIMLTQETFIQDRLLSPKVPYVALAITHLDLVDEKNRDRVVASIIGKLKLMKVSLPVVITNDVTLPSDQFKDLVGTDKLSKILEGWSRCGDRAKRIEVWLAAGIQRLLATGAETLEQKKQLFSAHEKERQDIITRKQKAITDMHAEWDKIRDKINAACDECKVEYKRKLQQETANLIEHMRYRVRNVSDPRKWYEQSYAYEIATRVSAAINSLDNVVTENARNDFESLNRELMCRYKVAMERDGKSWSRTPDSAVYAHQAAPEMVNVDALQVKSTKLNAIATAAGGLLATVLFGVGGMIGTIGASTAARLLTKNKIDGKVELARQQLYDFLPGDIEMVINDATKDCEGRITLIYNDMIRALMLSESEWMQTQQKLIADASKPAAEMDAKAVEAIDKQIEALNNLSTKFNKFID